jgi:hypothetical protein
MVNYTANVNSFVPEKPRVWIARLRKQFDLAPDGKRVVLLIRVDTPASPKAEHEVVVLLNFFNELRRRVPVSGE